MKSRIEKDSFGELNVPENVYWGIQTQRAIHNYPHSIKFPVSFIKAQAIIKKSAAFANSKLDKKVSKAIIQAADEIISGKHLDQFPLPVYQSGAGVSQNMNMNEVLANRAIEILKGKKGNYMLVNPNDDANMSQSTNDTIHSTIHIAAFDLIVNNLQPALDNLIKSLEKKSKEYSKIIKSGRTHLQDAVPMTLGQQFSGYTQSVSNDLERIMSSASSLRELNLGGTAIGTGINASKIFKGRIIRQINKITKLNFKPAPNLFEATQNTYAELHVSGTLKSLATTLIKISNDLRLQSSGPIGGMGEIVLPALQQGSSIMPGKINPVIPEMVEMSCFQIIGNDTTITLATQESEFELNVMMPVIGYNLINSVELLVNAVKSLDEKCIRGLHPNLHRIKEHLENNPIIVTALSPYIGYQKAGEIAYEAYRRNKPIREILQEKKLFNKKQLDKILDLKKLVKFN